MNLDFWNKKRVFLTGHTGFKGAWTALWLAQMGAEVHGYSLAPSSDNALYNQLKLDSQINSTIAPLEDYGKLIATVSNVQPEIIIHMAAQSLVKLSYDEPLETLATNILGTANLLNTMRFLPKGGAAVMVTSDKCYENREVNTPYFENAPMGGKDPYSASKGCAELVISSYRNSYFKNSPWRIAAVRSGNIFGGGDWAENRIIPDYFRAIKFQRPLKIRNPNAIRPWLFVLDTVHGYLKVAEKCFNEQGHRYAEGWNFGPNENATKTVEDLIGDFGNIVTSHPTVEFDSREHHHEATLLRLNSDKARKHLGWSPIEEFSRSIQFTSDWYEAELDGKNLESFSKQQLNDYINLVTS